MKSIILQKGKEKSLNRLHPWLFSGAIKTKDKDIKEGDLVRVLSFSGQYLASGYYQDESIAVKILTFEDEEINQDFFSKKILSSIRYRETLGFFSDEDNTMFRLINAEGDFLPGLIADYYAGKIVLQFHSIGMYLLKNMIINAIVKNLPNVEVIYSKSSNTLPHKANIVAKDEILYTKNDLTISTTNDNEYWKAKEKGLTYFIDYLNGQKTGFFLDQQYNRSLVRELSKDRMVLNCFCYTGGFSIAALAGKAKQVDSIDISKRALMVCEKNATENGFNCSHSTKCEDVVTYIDKIEKDYYDLIILDPPAFAKHNKDLHNALRGYRTINQKAMEKIKSGGLLFTFSCSQVVSKEDFLTMLFSCAVLSNRKVRIVKRLFQNTDHPQSIFHPEGDYLKGFLLYVE